MGFSTQKSWKKYEHNLKYLAYGSSTGSKIPHLKNIEPALIVRGKGCRVWDMAMNILTFVTD